MVQRAGRQGGQAEHDLTDLVRINVNRIMYVVNSSGILLVAFAAGLVTTLITLGFFYDVEFAQALFFLVAPMTIIGGLNVFTGRKIVGEACTGARLRQVMGRHRLITQIIGMISIFISALFGMAQNLLVTGPLGG